MKFGICTGFGRQELVVPHLEFIKKCGFDYLELPLMSLADLNDGEFEKLSQHLKIGGLPVLACNCFVGPEIPLTGPRFSPHLLERYAEKAVGRAARLGAKKLVLGSGGARSVPAGYPVDRARAQLQVVLDIILAVCRPHAIQLEIEHLNLQESNIITSFRQSSDLVQSRNDPNLKTVFDYFHFAVGCEDLRLVLQRAGTIGHMHFARPLGRAYPEQADLPDLHPVFDAIVRSGYDDTLSLECAFPLIEQEPVSYWAVLEELKKILAHQ